MRIQGGCVRILFWSYLMIQATLIHGESNVSYSEPLVIQVKDTEWTSQLADKNHQVKVEGPNITIEGDEFMLNGKPLKIYSGSIHYFRLPSEYWRDRLQKLKSAGLNAVSTVTKVDNVYYNQTCASVGFGCPFTMRRFKVVTTLARCGFTEFINVYVEWSFHQPEEGNLLFEGDQDVKRFIEIAAEEGLYVLLRPGPYICAERDLGGFPYWLLSKYPNIKLRTTDQDFIRESEIWIAKLFAQVATLLFGNGGPIILVQVENEYGSYGSDKTYMGRIRDMIKEYVGDNALLYTADGTYKSMIYDGAVNGALTAINFGAVNSVMDTIKPLRQYMPTGPLMNAEFYPGWLTHWGESIQQVSTDVVIRTLRDLLQHNISFNFYMFFGGTNFEFTAGANHFVSYLPDITSYDYDAPLTEAGDPTTKYYSIRDTMIKHLNLESSPAPMPSKKGAYGLISVSHRINLLSVAGRNILGVRYENVNGFSLPTFEGLRQRSGLVLYEVTLSEAGGILEIKKPRDWIYVYVNGEYQGIVNRMNQVYSLTLTAGAGSVLSLLVENQGRINYGNQIHDFKGILGTISFNNRTLSGVWSITGYPLGTPSIAAQSEQVPEGNESLSRLNRGPVLFGNCFVLPSTERPLDTFLDPTGWGKGYIWINGRNLGRYWPGVGPQVTLYVPGVWLNPAPAENCIQMLELESAPVPLTVEFLDYPILNRTSHK